MHYMNIDKHKCMHYLSMKKIEGNFAIKYIPFDPFKIKIIVKTMSQII
jgi:hypothetical protein